MKNQPDRLLNGSVGLHNKFFITAFSHTSVQLPSFIFICSIVSLNSSKKSKNSVLEIHLHFIQNGLHAKILAIFFLLLQSAKKSTHIQMNILATQDRPQ